MAQYKIESPLLDGFTVGDLVSASDFAEGTNLDALVEGGFITLSKAKPEPKSELPKESTNG